MSGHRVVGGLECVACADPPAFQHHQSRDPRNMEIPVSTGRNLYLSVGNRISIFYLEQPNTEDLVDLHLCNARRDWHYHGDVSLRVRYDRSERGSVRSQTWPHGVPHNQLTAPESCFVKIGLDRQSRSCPTQPFCWYRACLPKTTAPGIVSQPVNPEDWAAVPTRPTDWRLDTCC